jgi:hypothetical protein
MEARELDVGATGLSPPILRPPATLRYFGRDHCIAWHGNVQLIVSNEPPTLQSMALMANELDALAARCKAEIGCLLIIHANVSPPDERVRSFIKAKLERSAIAAAAQVVLGKGFRGAAMRSMLSLLQIAIRPKYAMRICGTSNEGCDWLVKVLRDKGLETPPVEALEATASKVCSKFFP